MPYFILIISVPNAALAIYEISMIIDDGDQERWEELPGGPEREGEQTVEGESKYIGCVKVAEPIYTYKSSTGPIDVRQEAHKVSMERFLWQFWDSFNASQNCYLLNEGHISRGHAGTQLPDLAIIPDSSQICRESTSLKTRLLEGQQAPPCAFSKWALATCAHFQTYTS